jgi:hypothetical protein
VLSAQDNCKTNRKASPSTAASRASKGAQSCSCPERNEFHWVSEAMAQRKVGYTAQSLFAEVARKGDPNACFACARVLACYDTLVAGRDNSGVMRIACDDCAPAVLKEVTASMRVNPPPGNVEAWSFR